MTLVTLHRQAPVVPNATTCSLCNARVSGTFQDHLLVGQPGTSQLRAVVCERCGQTLIRLVEMCGPDLNVLVQDARPSMESLVGTPRTGAAPDAERSPQRSKLDDTRRRLEEEADSLGRTERALRAEADHLKHDV